jgi:hypothetical protein
MRFLLSRIPVNSQKLIANRLLIAAGSLALVAVLGFAEFASSSEEECSGFLVWRSCSTTEVPLDERLPSLLLGIGMAGLAIVCALAAGQLTSMQGRLKRYPAILAGLEEIPIQRIAEITNSRPAQVRHDIQSMIDSAMISDFYIDYTADHVVSKKYIPKTSYKTVVTCSSCGGANELIVGITRACSFCGQPLVLGTT